YNSMIKNYPVFTLLFLPFLISCALNRHSKNEPPINRLIFLSQYSVPYNQQFEKTTIGGLSGLDYNPEKNEYYFISDDRSEFNPARFYKAAISINKDKIDSVIFLQTIFLKDSHGNFYPC